MSLGLGLGLGLARQRRAKKKAKSFVLTNNTVLDQPTKRIQFNAPVLVRTTGNTVLGNVMLDATGTVGSISPADGWVMVRNTAETYRQFTLAGVGTVEFQDAKKVSYLYLNGALISVSGDIGKLTQLTSLALNGALISVSGDIGKLTQLTSLALSGDLISVSGDIGKLTQLTIFDLWKYGGTGFYGNIVSPNFNTFISISMKHIINIEDISSLPIVKLVATNNLGQSNTTISGTMPSTITESLVLGGDKTTIVIPDGFSFVSLKQNVSNMGAAYCGIQMYANLNLDANSIRNLFIAANNLANSPNFETDWNNTTRIMRLTDGASPGYNGTGGIKNEYDNLIAKGITIYIPASWRGGTFPNDFPS